MKLPGNFSSYLGGRVQRLGQAVAVEVAVALVAIAHQDEVVPVVAPAGHAGVLARRVLARFHAPRTVESVRHLSNEEHQKRYIYNTTYFV